MKKVALVNTMLGRHPCGGPCIHGYNQLKALSGCKNLDIVGFHGGEIHKEYKKKLKGIEIHHVDELKLPYKFDAVFVQCGIEIINKLAISGYRNIISGSNILPNSAPEHCREYLNSKLEEEEKRDMARLLRCTKLWTAQSRFQRREYFRLGMPVDFPVRILRNPLDTDLFNFVQDESRLGDAVIWSGKMNWAKNVQDLHSVAEELPDQSFIVISDGEGIREYPFPENVEVITGNTLYEVPKLLEKGSIFLSTSLTENEPLAVLEAMSRGLVPIGYKTSGMTEIIRDGSNGVLVSLGNINHIIKEIEFLQKNVSEWRRMRNNAREHVLKNNSYSAFVKNFKRVVREVR